MKTGQGKRIYLKKMVPEGFLKQENLDMLLLDGTVGGLIKKMKDYKPLPVPKWIEKDQV